LFASLAEQQDHREFTFGNSWEFDLLQILAVFPGNFAKNTFFSFSGTFSLGNGPNYRFQVHWAYQQITICRLLAI